MRRKFVLGILVLVLVFLVILWGFSDFDGDVQSFNEELRYSLEPILSEPEPTPEQEPT